MGFKLAIKDSITKKVRIEVPGDFDKVEIAELIVCFKKLPVSQVRELVESLTRDDSPVSDADILRKNIIDIKNLEDEAGEKLEFTEEVMDTLLEANYILQPLVKTFMQIQTDIKEEKRKN